jgi:hypothetical protein
MDIPSVGEKEVLREGCGGIEWVDCLELTKLEMKENC